MQRTFLSRLLLSAVLLAGTALSPARAYVGLCCGKCGGNMPMNIPGGGIPETHEYRFKLGPSLMHMAGLRDGTHGVSADSLLGMPAMGGFMAVPTDMDMKMLNLAMGYSFTDRFFAGAMFMWNDKRMDMRFNKMMRGITGRDGFTMTSRGLGDTMLMAKYRLFADDPLIPTRQGSLFFALSLPTGSIDERNRDHPVAMRRRELLPYGMQLGSGTFDPTLGYLYQGSRSPYWWGVNAMVTARLYDNKRDYRLGDALRLDAYLMYQVSARALLQAQLNLHRRGRIRGEMDEAASGASGHAVQGDAGSPYATPLWDPDNYGGTQAFVTLGAQWQPAEFHVLDFQVALPLYRDLNGPQLETDYRVMFTWFYELPTSRSIRYRGPRPGGTGRLGF